MARGTYRESVLSEIARLTRDGLRLDKPTIEAIGKAEAQHSRSGRVALWDHDGSEVRSTDYEDFYQMVAAVGLDAR